MNAVLFSTAIGPCAMGWTTDGIRAFCFPEKNTAETKKRLEARMRARAAQKPVRIHWRAPPADVSEVIETIQAHLTGTPQTSLATIKLDETGLTPFRLQVYRELRMLGAGETISYDALSQRIKCSGAARAVGTAMAKNRLPLLIPCHRVVAKSGEIGAFSAHKGPVLKRQLLTLEGATLDKVLSR